MQRQQRLWRTHSAQRARHRDANAFIGVLKQRNERFVGPFDVHFTEQCGSIANDKPARIVQEFKQLR